MNSDSDSDWDSMSEAPPITNNNAIDNNPSPLKKNQETRNKINSQQHFATHSNSQTENYDREKANIIAQKAAVKHWNRVL